MDALVNATDRDLVTRTRNRIIYAQGLHYSQLTRSQLFILDSIIENNLGLIMALSWGKFVEQCPEFESVDTIESPAKKERVLPIKLRVLTGVGEDNLGNESFGYGHKSLSALAKKHGVKRQDLSAVIHGRRQTPKLCRILVIEWRLSIKEIREIVREDRERKKNGQPVTLAEAQEFYDWVRCRYFAGVNGTTIEHELREMKERAEARKAAGL